MPHDQMWRQVNGTRLFFRKYGAAPSPDKIVVLHHGYTASGLTWEPCAATLSAIDPSLCIVVPDCRGAGVHSSGAGSEDKHFTIAQLADDIICLVNLLQAEAQAEAGVKTSDPKFAGSPWRFAFCGHSMGGMVGVQLALAYPARVRALVLCAPAALEGLRDIDESFHEMARAVRLQQLKEGTEGEVARKSGLQAAVLAHPRAADILVAAQGSTAVAAMTPTTVQAAMEASLYPYFQASLCASQQHFELLWTAMTTFNPDSVTEGGLNALKTPTLVCAGAADDLLRTNLADFGRLSRTATLHVFSRVGHGLPRECPTELAYVINDFLVHGVVRAYHLRQQMVSRLSSL